MGMKVDEYTLASEQQSGLVNLRIHFLERFKTLISNCRVIFKVHEDWKSLFDPGKKSNT